LRNDQKLLYPGGDEALGLAQHVGGRARDQIAPQFRDDAEAAAVVAALRNLQIGIVPRRKLDALGGQEIEERVMARRQRAMHCRDHALVLLRTSDREDPGVTGGDLLRLGAHAAGHDHLAVLVERLADGSERFRLGAVEKAAGVDDREVGAGMGANKFIALRAQARDDALAVDQRLRAAERDKAHSRRARRLRRGMSIFHGRGATRAGRREQAGTLCWRITVIEYS